MAIPYLPRINVLARLAKSRPLTTQEQHEQHTLRQNYLRQMRGKFSVLMLSIRVEDEDGRDITPANLYYAKRNS